MGKDLIEKLCKRLSQERALTLMALADMIAKRNFAIPAPTDDEMSVLDVLELIVNHDKEIAGEVLGAEEEEEAGPFLHPLYFIRLVSETHGKALTALSSMSDEDLEQPFGTSGLTMREVVEEIIAEESELLRPALEKHKESRGN